MFTCEHCHNATKPRQRAFLVITEKRPKEYQQVITKIIEGEKVEKTITTRGWEVVKEKRVCEDCFELYYNYDHKEEIFHAGSEKN